MPQNADHPVSEVTEITDHNLDASGRHFGAAWGWGTVSGTGAMMTTSLVFASTGDGAIGPLAGIVAGSLFVGLFTGAITLAGMIVIGLPVTFLLKLLRLENQPLYALLGTMAGAASLAAWVGFDALADTAVLFFITPGACAGFAAAWRWGQWREAVQARDLAEFQQ